MVYHGSVRGGVHVQQFYEREVSDKCIPSCSTDTPCSHTLVSALVGSAKDVVELTLRIVPVVKTFGHFLRYNNCQEHT